jgi:hypothetical protein
VRRSSLFFSVLYVVFVFGASLAQPAALPHKLGSLPHELEAHPDDNDTLAKIDLDAIVQAATPAEIKEVVPVLVNLTESSNPHLRGQALLVLYAIACKWQAGSREQLRRDFSASEAIVPYLPRLEPRLMDSSTPCRRMSLLLFQALTAISPAPPELIKAALTVLKDPQSTHAMPNTIPGSLPGSATSPGPPMLWILLRAAATYYLDPATHITEGRDSPEVQTAIIEFLRRSDQTTESLSESIRAIALAQAQNPAVNAALLPLLSSADVELQRALLRQIAKLTLTSDDFASARTRVSSIKTDPNTPEDVQKLAGSLLSCWSNDRHHDGCPSL